ncbi:putative tRNA (uracil-5-)-methyltransferase trm9 protein [Rosellinia necatrix]|uniref:Putative tRNA (Uracil-5-)-methyltransferase trm9 protein n=1 Tax=Rosellinia necatrix TaxID=77044 RepID=A0A1S7UKL9_ROSNE|nr:putative tRNA (uracil-5-)-methyltransferase trm9 protein [Rosellinia necatrix]
MSPPPPPPLPSSSCPTDSHDAEPADAKMPAAPPPPSPPASPPPLLPTSTAAAVKPNAVREAAARCPEAYEDEHVHSVYESIAGHFSSTRHKPWPFVASFLRERVAPGSIGLDVGCGNGKYLGVRQEAAAAAAAAAAVAAAEGGGGGGGDGGGGGGGVGDVHIVGSDRSPSLVGIARRRGFDVAVADGLALPFRRRAADFALCIAVVHHLSTRARRVDALRGLLECVREDGGQVLVYVWALEQRASRRGWDATSEQDQLVPWVTKAGQRTQTQTQTQTQTKSQSQSGSGSGSGSQAQGGSRKDKGKGKDKGEGEGEGDARYERFYHLYREGELEEDMRAAGGRVLESGYERDNCFPGPSCFIALVVSPIPGGLAEMYDARGFNAVM